MATLEFIVIMAIAVLLSSILDQVLTKISPPLIQIGLGLLLSLIFLQDANATLDPELFMLLFIAPLLFNDAREVDRLALWRNRVSILSLAIGLVIAIVLAVGFAMHALVPSIPLVAAFALGAALGPTDAVAVQSLTRSAKLERRTHVLLQGEALINDASGVISFQFAVAAATTGAFSLVDGTTSFLATFFGGILAGVALGALIYFIRRKAADAGVESTTFHVLLDVLAPFAIYLLTEMIHVSGILAVVAAGLLLGALNSRIIGPNSARLGIVTSSVWKVLSYTLNGIVFVMLGMQLPSAMENLIVTDEISTWLLILYVLVLTAIVFAVRFAWTYVMARSNVKKLARARQARSQAGKHAHQGFERIGASAADKGSVALTRSEKRRAVREALVSTIGGAKGAITLSIIMSLPLLTGTGEPFPNRELIIFLASGAILCTLLMANFLLPALAPIPKEEDNHLPESAEEVGQAKVDILRSVINELIAHRNPDNKAAVRVVIRSYRDRITRVSEESDLASSETVRLRLTVLEQQKKTLSELYHKGKVSKHDLFVNMMSIARTQNRLTSHRGTMWVVAKILQHFPTAAKVGWESLKSYMKIVTQGTPPIPSVATHVELERSAIDFLENLQKAGGLGFSEQVIEDRLEAHRSMVAHLDSPNMTFAPVSLSGESVQQVRSYAYRVELDTIAQWQNERKISRATARVLRRNVYLMMVELEEDF